MADKKIIERNLKFSDQYVYIDTKRGSILDGDVTCCDNCGKIIANICHVVRKSDNKHFYIGTDCAETLSKAKVLYNNGSQSDFYIDMYALGVVNRFVTQYNKTPELAEFNGLQWEIVTTETKDGKVKVKSWQAFSHDLKKYAPETFNLLNNS